MIIRISVSKPSLACKFTSDYLAPSRQIKQLVTKSTLNCKRSSQTLLTERNVRITVHTVSDFKAPDDVVHGYT